MGDRVDELARLPVADVVDDVSLGKHAHDPIVLDHGQPPDLSIHHLVDRLAERFVRIGRTDAGRCDVADPRRPRIAVSRKTPRIPTISAFPKWATTPPNNGMKWKLP